MNKLKYLDLFSGIGAFGKAMTNLGVDYELVGFSEVDKWAIESYCAIHGVSRDLNLGDIAQIKESDMPEADLVTYGFPCQDISIAGKQDGIRNDTRSGLLFEAERVIQNIRPRYAIAENVKNLIGKKHKADFEQLLQRLDSYGYNNYWQVLNAKDYNIPQNRERVFIVSIRKDVDDGKFQFPEGCSNTKDFREYLDTTGVYLELKDYNKVKGLGADYSFGGYVAPDNQKVYSTITASYGKTSGNSMKFRDQDQYRYLKPIETWRLMGFTDRDFYNAQDALQRAFYPNVWRGDSQMYKQAGNSIVVPVLEAIFKELFKAD